MMYFRPKNSRCGDAPSNSVFIVATKERCFKRHDKPVDAMKRKTLAHARLKERSQGPPGSQLFYYIFYSFFYEDLVTLDCVHTVHYSFTHSPYVCNSNQTRTTVIGNFKNFSKKLKIILESSQRAGNIEFLLVMTMIIGFNNRDRLHPVVSPFQMNPVSI